ncbi:MAG: hypothetical protein AAF414_06510 [Pseudomonadota bacterium]
MPADLPQSLDEIGVDWVVNALRSERYETSPITGLRIEPLSAENSSVAQLHLAGPAAHRQLPSTLFLKLCPPGHDFLGASEIAYYTRDYEGLSGAPIIRCYAAAGPRDVAMANSLGAGYALLLADLTTGFTDNKLIEPTGQHAALLGRSIGRLHAHRWGPNADPEGRHDLGADLDRCLAHVSRGLSPVLDTLGDTLDVSDRSRLVRVLEDDVEQLRIQALEGSSLTLVHGDPNPTNVLTQRSLRDGSGAPALYLIDRQPFAWSLRLWLGASDLVLASVPYWSVNARREHQGALLKGYHAAIIEGGIIDYDWDALIGDWRACLCHAVLVAVEWGTNDSTLTNMRWLWEPQLRRAIAALRDWDREDVVR